MKRYRMAVVGLHFGKWLIDNEIIKGYAAPYFELAAVCDQNEVLAHACAREYHVKAYTRLEDALADRDIDLVTLITGPNPVSYTHLSSKNKFYCSRNKKPFTQGKLHAIL